MKLSLKCISVIFYTEGKGEKLVEQEPLANIKETLFMYGLSLEDGK